jgi:putative aldouronate transport system substrate-binding protein
VAIRKNDPEAKAVLIYETPEYETGVKTLRNWYEKGYIRPDIASVIDDNQDFKMGKYVITPTNYKPGIEQNQSSMFNGQQFTCALVDNGAYLSTSGCVATMYGVSKNSKNPNEAVKFIELINTDAALYNLIANGIEGKHYTKVDGKHIKYIPNSGYYPNSSWKFGNQFNAFLIEGQDAGLWEETEKMNNTAQKSRLLGFSLNTDDITTEISQYQSVNGEYAALRKGAADYKELLPVFIKKANDNGAKKILAEVQKQIDAFLASKN